MTQYEAFEKKRQLADKALDDFTKKHREVVTEYVSLLHEKIDATRAASKALVTESGKTEYYGRI